MSNFCRHLAGLWPCVKTQTVCPCNYFALIVITLLYMVYPDGCRHKNTFPPRLRQFPVRGYWLLSILETTVHVMHMLARYLINTDQVCKVLPVMLLHMAACLGDLYLCVFSIC